jgi:hypothetical protein
VQRKSEERAIRQIFATEFASLRPHKPRDPLLLARTVFETLTNVDCGAYLHWDLAWGYGSGEGSLFLVENPWDEGSWVTEKGYQKTASFDWFVHFARFILPGMTRIACNSSSSVDQSVKALCFLGVSGETTVIMVNFSTKMAMVTLDGLPAVGSNPKRRLYRSTLTEGFTEATKTMPPLADTVFLPGESIGTLYSGRL